MYIDAKLPPPNSKIWSIVLTPRRRHPWVYECQL